MLKINAATFAVCFAGLCLLLIRPSSACEVQTTSLCALAARPSSFNLKDVRVRASVMSDGIHRTVLMDRSCPGKGVAFVVLHRSADDAGVKEIMHAIYHLGGIGAGVFGKHIEATVSGIFLWEPDNSRATRRLLVESVSDVTVSMDQPKSRKRSNATQAVKPDR